MTPWRVDVRTPVGLRRFDAATPSLRSPCARHQAAWPSGGVAIPADAVGPDHVGPDHVWPGMVAGGAIRSGTLGSGVGFVASIAPVNQVNWVG